MHLSWSTDIHLNFLSPDQRADFARRVAADAPDALLVTGDISEAPELVSHLVELHDVAERPLYFVLGNHDFYRASIAAVRAMCRELSELHHGIFWLPGAGVVELTARAALIGVDGWGDARAGNWEHSRVRFKDIRLISELVADDYPEVVKRLRALGDAEADTLRPLLADACARYPEVVVATHVPPFVEACWHQGGRCHEDFIPWLTCTRVGDALLAAAEAHPDCQLSVYCGHTHGEGTAEIRDNLVVHTGGAVYGAPAVSGLLTID